MLQYTGGGVQQVLEVLGLLGGEPSVRNDEDEEMEDDAEDNQIQQNDDAEEMPEEDKAADARRLDDDLLVVPGEEGRSRARNNREFVIATTVF
jgi:hypothetical protein